MTKRCESCGSPPNLPHLRNCKVVRDYNTPTVKMLDLANNLLAELMWTVPKPPSRMTFAECSALIDRMLKAKEDWVDE